MKLAYKDWELLDDLLSKHGFGGYYDLLESIKDIARGLGISHTGLDLNDVKDLTTAVMTLSLWVTKLRHHPEFQRIAEEAAK